MRLLFDCSFLRREFTIYVVRGSWLLVVESPSDVIGANQISYSQTEVGRGLTIPRYIISAANDIKTIFFFFSFFIQIIVSLFI